MHHGSADISTAGLTAVANGPSGYDPHLLGRSSQLQSGCCVKRKLATTFTGPFGGRGHVDGGNVVETVRGLGLEPRTNWLKANCSTD